MNEKTKQFETKARVNLRKLRAVEGFKDVADSLEALLDGAAKGGKSRARKLSKKRRVEIAKKAANARWGKSNEAL